MNSIPGDTIFTWWENLQDRWKGVQGHREEWAAVGSIVWRLWKCRNDVVFNNIAWRPDVACSKAILEASEFLKAVIASNEIRGGMQGDHALEQTKWEKPLRGWVKVNFDGGLDKINKTSGLGIVIRNADGSFRAARAVHIGNLMNPMVLEGMAARESLVFAKELGLQKVQLEGDSQRVIQMIQKEEEINIEVGTLVEGTYVRQAVQKSIWRVNASLIPYPLHKVDRVHHLSFFA